MFPTDMSPGAALLHLVISGLFIGLALVCLFDIPLGRMRANLSKLKSERKEGESASVEEMNFEALIAIATGLKGILSFLFCVLFIYGTSWFYPDWFVNAWNQLTQR